MLRRYVAIGISRLAFLSLLLSLLTASSAAWAQGTVPAESTATAAIGTGFGYQT